MTPSVQWLTLGWMLFSGVMMGMAYDSYRVLSGRLHFPRWVVHALDLLYWCASAIFVFRMLYISNYGQLRFYVFLGLFIGVWVYFLFLSVTTQRFVVMLLKVVTFLIHLLKTWFIILVWLPMKMIYRFFKGLIHLVGRILLSVFRVVMWFLSPFTKLGKWILSPIAARLRIPKWIDKLINFILARWRRWF